MSKIEVIIPTRNRNDFLKRILDYYQSHSKGLSFLIADSSSNSIKKKNKQLVSKYKNMRIRYLDKFPENMEQHYKFSEMVKYIKARYCVFCADDDFIVPEAIKTCAKFLDKNPNYVAVHGTYIGYHLYNGIFGKNKFWWQFRHTPISITSSKAMERLCNHLEHFTLTIWAVRKTAIVKACYKEFRTTKIDSYILPILGELIPDALTAVFGKIKHINTFYSARQYFGSIRGTYPSLIDAKNWGKYENNYSQFKKVILRNIPKSDGLSKQEASTILDSTMEKYIGYSYQEHLMNKLFSLLKPLPESVALFIRFLHEIYLFSKPKVNKLGQIQKPTSKFYSDFTNIKQSILEHAA